MSIVADQVKRVDTQLDRLQLLPHPHSHGLSKSGSSSPTLSYRRIPSRDHFDNEEAEAEESEAHQPRLEQSARISELQSIIKDFTSTSRKPLSAWRIQHLLGNAGLNPLSDELAFFSEQSKSEYEKELEWLLISKATVHTYGLLLRTLLEQTIPLQDEQWYWDEIAGSWLWMAVWTTQMLPIRGLEFSKEIYSDASARFTRLTQLRQRRSQGDESDSDSSGLGARAANGVKDIGEGVLDGWKEFYDLIRQSIAERSVSDIQSRVLSPLAKSRKAIRQKQSGLRRLREMSAAGLGLLIEECLDFPTIAEAGEDVDAQGLETQQEEYRSVVERSVGLMDSVLKNVTMLEAGTEGLEDMVFSAVEDSESISERGIGGPSPSPTPAKLAIKLQTILEQQIPKHIQEQRRLRAEYGRPGVLVRYWLPATVLLLSSTTILRILVNRKAELIQWSAELATTVRDFWANWVVEPTRKVIKTIRHDEGSEVAIMSKESLKGDRDSLERMVVDFVVDKSSSPMTESAVEELRSKVGKGDLTPVLKAYEKDLRKPFIGTVRGDLIRTLLIQVQKTKVDVEVALSGIDALLKSQELVFGFVGLTPGILVTFSVTRWLSGAFGTRRSKDKQRKKGKAARVLRNIDRLLLSAVIQGDGDGRGGRLGYKDHGLLLCEIEVLRQVAEVTMDAGIRREFMEDVAELGYVRSGVDNQRRVSERIRWCYGRWLGL